MYARILTGGARMAFSLKENYGPQDLIEIIRILRAPDGCPWDREQTHASIRMNFIEETYEAVEAIDKEDSELLREELGDVLMQVALHAQMEAEAGRFDFDGVCDRVCKKLIYRHPHVFGSAKVETAGQVLQNWDELKKKEKDQQTLASNLEAVPVTLPGAMRAAKVQKRAAGYGLCWQDAAEPLEQLSEAGKRLSAAEESERQLAAQQLLFAAVGAVRAAGLNPELSLTRACEQVTQLLARREAESENGLAELSDEEKKQLWREITMFPNGENPL